MHASDATAFVDFSKSLVNGVQEVYRPNLAFPSEDVCFGPNQTG